MVDVRASQQERNIPSRVAASASMAISELAGESTNRKDNYRIYPFILPIGVSFATGLLNPAKEVASTTVSISLYAPPASSARLESDIALI